MGVRAKFKLKELRRYSANIEAMELIFEAVSCDEVPENQRFHQYTPSGTLSMYVNNPAASNQFDSARATTWTSPRPPRPDQLLSRSFPRFLPVFSCPHFPPEFIHSQGSRLCLVSSRIPESSCTLVIIRTMSTRPISSSRPGITASPWNA